MSYSQDLYKKEKKLVSILPCMTNSNRQSNTKAAIAKKCQAQMLSNGCEHVIEELKCVEKMSSVCRSVDKLMWAVALPDSQSLLCVSFVPMMLHTTEAINSPVYPQII